MEAGGRNELQWIVLTVDCLPCLLFTVSRWTVLRLLTAGLLRRTEAAKARMVLLSCGVRGDSDLSCGSRESNSKTKAPDSQTGVVRRG